MKKHIFITVLVSILILSIFVYSRIVEGENLKPKIENTSSHTINKNDENKVVSGIKSLGFKFKVSTQVLSDSNEEMASSIFEGKIALKKEKALNVWLGQVIDSKLKQQTEKTQLASSVLFKTQYENFVFKNTDFLGLNKSHPINAVTHLLSELSYQLDEPLSISKASGSAVYKYELLNNKLTRKIFKRKNADLENMSIDKIDENWSLVISKNNLPIKLNSVLDTHYINQDAHFVVKQIIYISAINMNVNWPNSNDLKMVNSNLKFKTTEVNQSFKITSEHLLKQALTKLASMPDEALAKEIGQYLLENYTLDELVNLIENKNLNPKLASLIIYAIQKNPTFSAEVTLVNLLAHPDLQGINKQRVVMSLGRFEAVSDLSLNSLKALVETPDNALANTAKLSIGTVARYNEIQKSEVKQYLSEQLSMGTNLDVTLLAINNSGITNLNAQAADLLGSTEQNVNVSLIKLLAKDSKYHDKIINFAVNSNQPKSIDALSRSVASQNLTLTALQKSHIIEKIRSSKNQIVKDQLKKLLNKDKHQW
ncbi:hypothetical protein [Pseudoalteromonas denitrificans]|nr:hypothetical protein [Pseudoalteromonas denitrificans]